MTGSVGLCVARRLAAKCAEGVSRRIVQALSCDLGDVKSLRGPLASHADVTSEQKTFQFDEVLS